MSRRIRLTESDLRRIIREAVNDAIDGGGYGCDVTGNAQNAMSDYQRQVEQHKDKLRRLIPHLGMMSPEDREMVLADMKKYGINPRG